MPQYKTENPNIRRIVKMDNEKQAKKKSLIRESRDKSYNREPNKGRIARQNSSPTCAIELRGKARKIV